MIIFNSGIILFVFSISTVTDCQKKWINIRDQYNKSKGKKLGTGSAAELKKRRNDLMVFLDEVVVTNKKYENLFNYESICNASNSLSCRTTTNIATAITDDPDEVKENYESEEENIRPTKRRRSSSNGDQVKLLENIANTFRDNSSRRNDLIQHIMNESKPKTELEVYFNSICLTVGKLDPLEQARVKMQISQIVSQAELSQLEKSQSQYTTIQNWSGHIHYQRSDEYCPSELGQHQPLSHTIQSTYTNL